jgi:Domain of unknown function (DUF5615)
VSTCCRERETNPVVRFLLNEKMPGSLAQKLRDDGHDVLGVKEAMQGADDVAVLARAQSVLGSS